MKKSELFLKFVADEVNGLDYVVKALVIYFLLPEGLEESYDYFYEESIKLKEIVDEKEKTNEKNNVKISPEEVRSWRKKLNKYERDLDYMKKAKEDIINELE